MNAGLKIKRRDDLIPAAVDLEFRVTGTWNGEQYTQVVRDIAATISGSVVEGVGLPGALNTLATFASASPVAVSGTATTGTQGALLAAGQGFEAVTQTLDMKGASSSLATCTIVTLPVNLASPAGGGSALAFWLAVFPELKDISSPDFPTGAPAISVVDDSGAAVTTSGAGNFQYLLTRGQVAPWMLNGNTFGGAACQSKKCVVTATFTGTENATTMVSGSPVAIPIGIPQSHTKHATVTLITIQGGTYAKQTVTPGEIIPYGLAGYIYNIAVIPQYEGTFTIQETEVTDLCPLGNNLNITGCLAEWATMGACIQAISYDISAGRTNLTFGPAAHLGAKDFVERLRINRGPRWYNLNGNNIANDAGGQKGTQLGSDVAQFAPTPGPPAKTLQIFPTSVADYGANKSSYTGTPQGIPGATIDSAIASQPSYGGLGAPNAPVLHLAAGASGTLTTFARLDANGALNLQAAPAAQSISNTWIRLALADLAALSAVDQIYLQELPVCELVGGVPTQGYRIFLCGKFSATALL